MEEKSGNAFNTKSKKIGIIVLCLVIIAMVVVGITVALRNNAVSKSDNIDNIAILDAGYTYRLENGKFVILLRPDSHLTNSLIVVPLKVDTNDSEAYLADKAIYISDKVIAVAFGDKIAGSPVKVLITEDQGKTWNTSEVPNTIAVNYPVKYIGFSSTHDGWLILGGGVTMSQQEIRIFETIDCGKTWYEIGNPSSIYPGIVTGTAFANRDIGFVSYRYLNDPNPVVYRTTDRGKTWTKCRITIPDSFKSITTYASASSLAFNGASGVLTATFRNNSGTLNNEPVDVVVRYQTSDYGKTWTFDEKYNLALIWAQAWSTRDGRARYEIMDSKMQEAFVKQNRSDEDPNKVYYVIRWSSPWVQRYDVKVEGDHAIITYYYTDSGEETYRSSEQITFGTENGKLVVSGYKELAPLEDYIDTSNWKKISTNLFTFFIPSSWNISTSPDGMTVYFMQDGQQMGDLYIKYYDQSKDLSQLFGTDAKLLNKLTVTDTNYPAYSVLLERTSSTLGKATTNTEIHFFIVPDNSDFAYDLLPIYNRAVQQLEWVGKNITFVEDSVEKQLLSSRWAMAAKDRDGKALYNLMSKNLKKQAYDTLSSHGWVIGQSSPWIDSYSIGLGEDTSALTYAYMTSTGFAGYYTQVLTFSKEDGNFAVSNYTEPTYVESPDKGIVIAFLKENSTYLTASSINNDEFSNMTLYVNGKSHNYSWKTIANTYFLPKLVYSDLDKDGSNELGIVLCEEAGPYTTHEQINVINTEDFSEITVEDPITVLEKHVTTSIEKDNINITIDDQEPVWFTTAGVETVFGNRNTWLPNIKIDSKVQYYVSAGTLYAQVNAQLTPTGFLGNFTLTYSYDDEHLKVSNIAFASTF